MRQLTTTARAKVNLTLDVFHLRADGYHEVVTVLHELTLHDTVTLTRTEADHSPVVRSDDPALPDGRDNLAARAAHALWDELPRAVRPKGRPWPGLVMEITKHIPVGAGLGGGSADAAAVLRGLPRLWDLQLEAALLHRAAAAVGADVPFFLRGGTALATGTGTRLHQLAVPRSLTLPFILIVPPRGLATQAVYEAYDELPRPPERAPVVSLLRGLWEGNRRRVAKSLHNGLEQAAGALYEDLMPLKRALLDAGVLGAAMTGSGSTIFAIPNGWGRAAAAIAAARRCQPHARVVLTGSARGRP